MAAAGNQTLANTGRSAFSLVETGNSGRIFDFKPDLVIFFSENDHIP